jgi:hypothetical protein
MNFIKPIFYSFLSLFTFCSLFAQPVTWDASTSYSTGALVIVGTSTYVAEIDVPVNKTPPDTTYWKSLEETAASLTMTTDALAALPTTAVADLLATLPGAAPGVNSSTGGSTSVNLANLSTRGYVGVGDSQMIAGFIISGTGSTTVTIRALGPTLNTVFGVQGVLANPTMSVVDQSTGNVIVSNDNHLDAASATAVASSGKSTGINVLESAVQISLNPGSYTVVVGGNGGTGNALVEVYNENTTSTSITLANLSTRGYVGIGDSQMIAGVIINSTTTVTIRALGPTLNSVFGVQGVLANPTFSVVDQSTGNVIVSNDNHLDAASATAVASSGKSTGINALESAVQLSLSPGSYTVVVGGNGGTGNALVEIYDEGI